MNVSKFIRVHESWLVFCEKNDAGGNGTNLNYADTVAQRAWRMSQRGISRLLCKGRSLWLFACIVGVNDTF